MLDEPSETITGALAESEPSVNVIVPVGVPEPGETEPLLR